MGGWGTARRQLANSRTSIWFRERSAKPEQNSTWGLEVCCLSQASVAGRRVEDDDEKGEVHLKDSIISETPPKSDDQKIL